MRAGRRLGRRDANEASIVQALRQCGLLVHHVSAKGFCDLVVRSPRYGIVLLEVKSAKGKETRFQVEHRQDGWPVVIVRSVEAALSACGIQ